MKDLSLPLASFICEDDWNIADLFCFSTYKPQSIFLLNVVMHYWGIYNKHSYNYGATVTAEWRAHLSDRGHLHSWANRGIWCSRPSQRRCRRWHRGPPDRHLKHSKSCTSNRMIMSCNYSLVCRRQWRRQQQPRGERKQRWLKYEYDDKRVEDGGV